MPQDRPFIQAIYPKNQRGLFVPPENYENLYKYRFIPITAIFYKNEDKLNKNAESLLFKISQIMNPIKIKYKGSDFQKIYVDNIKFIKRYFDRNTFYHDEIPDKYVGGGVKDVDIYIFDTNIGADGIRLMEELIFDDKNQYKTNIYKKNKCNIISFNSKSRINKVISYPTDNELGFEGCGVAGILAYFGAFGYVEQVLTHKKFSDADLLNYGSFLSVFYDQIIRRDNEYIKPNSDYCSSINQSKQRKTSS